MRKGSNPQKTQRKIELTSNHRVVVVVYIPEPEGYYLKMLDVFKICLDSLIKTNQGDYKITVVDNGSCKELRDLLNSYPSGEIDCIVQHSTNIGKIDALIGAARGAREEFITLTDADILFQKDWNIETLKVFRTFRKVGSVSPIPFRHGLFYGTSSVFKQIIFKGLKFSYQEIEENFADHNRYLSSINWNNEKDRTNKWPVIERNKVKAIVGSGHQVLTVRRELLFSKVPKEPSLTLVGGNSEYTYIDEPIDKAGLMRLSTYNNKAYHMGNEVEDWMLAKLKETDNSRSNNECGESRRNFDQKDQAGFNSVVKQKAYGLRKRILKKVFRILYTH